MMAAYGILKCKYSLLKRKYHYVNSDFGRRTYINSAGHRVSDWHKGIDVQSNTADHTDYVLCPFAGRVIARRNNFSGQTTNTGLDGMGNYVKLDCGNGVVLRFQHLRKGSVTVENGDQVKAGQVIGHIGLTGNTSGYHLHFDICINGTYVDPKPYLTGAKSLPGAAHAGKPAPGNYVVREAVNVRQGAGINYNRVYYSQFTANAKMQVRRLDKSCPDCLPAGVKLTIKEVKQAANGKWWGKCPSGWVCMIYLKEA